MKISVIVPFNKGDDYLRDCLNSLAEMKYKDFDGPVEELVRLKLKEIEEKENIKVQLLVKFLSTCIFWP